MPILENVIFLHQEELTMGHRYYFYRSREEDENDKTRNIIGGVYILQSEIDGDPPDRMNLSLEWE